MKIFLQQQLASHRRGRFLCTQLNAESTETTPEAGLYLITGKDFQILSDEQKTKLFQWSYRPGRTLLLIPPFDEEILLTELDWQCVYLDSSQETDNFFVSLVKDEVNFFINGNDGQSDLQLGHQWSNHSVNTRFFKKNSGSGVFAMTCLPLWSISFLDESEACLTWLEGLTQRAGHVIKEENNSKTEQQEFIPTPQHYSVLVCVFAWNTGNLDKLCHSLSEQTVPIINIESDILVQSLGELSIAGLVDDHGLTEQGNAVLFNSSYWGYAEHLKEALL